MPEKKPKTERKKYFVEVINSLIEYLAIKVNNLKLHLLVPSSTNSGIMIFYEICMLKEVKYEFGEISE